MLQFIEVGRNFCMHSSLKDTIQYFSLTIVASWLFSFQSFCCRISGVQKLQKAGVSSSTSNQRLIWLGVWFWLSCGGEVEGALIGLVVWFVPLCRVLLAFPGETDGAWESPCAYASQLFEVAAQWLQPNPTGLPLQRELNSKSSCKI